MKKCIVCNSDKLSLIYNGTLFKCDLCSYIFANIGISNEKLSDIYCENYFKGNEYLDYLSDKIVIQKNFQYRLNKIQTFKSNIDLNTIEIGCAYGFFGELFVKNNKNSSYLGIDIVAEAINYGKNEFGLNLIAQDYLTFVSPQKYSHVFMWDVIEHLEHPDLFIEKISNETVSGSELYITTGDIGSILSKIQKQNWRMIHPPSHLHYFSKKTISLLLAKFNFEIKSIEYNPVFRSVKQIFYSLFLLNRPGRLLARKIFKHIPENWFIPINTYA